MPPGPKLGHVGITHSDVSVSQRIKMENPDSNEQILTSNDNAKKLGMIFGSDVYDSLTSTGAVTFTGTGTCRALVAA